MKLKFICAVCVSLIAGCESGGQMQASKSAETNSSSVTKTDLSSITKKDIEICWKKAGIRGDLYKFMTPEEAVGIRPGGVFSEQQAEKFAACLRA